MTNPAPRVAFVFGGGGVRGAVELGMLQALLERDIYPDLLVGTSIGAMNAAAVANEPNLSVIDTLTESWKSPEAQKIYGDSWYSQAARALRTQTHIISPDPLRQLLEGILGPNPSFSDLPVPLKVVAANIENSRERVFDSGPLIPAIMASAAVPGLFPPTEIDGLHYVDGGVVNSIPVSPAVEAGATEIYVLQVGRIEERLEVPQTPVETAQVTFEISRRHRFFRDAGNLPDGTTLHLLPSGGQLDGDHKASASRDLSKVPERIKRGYTAASIYLDNL